MTTTWKPNGYSTVSPYLIAEGAQQVVDFLKKGFGATELRRYDMPDGSIMHAEVMLDDSVIMIGDAGGEWLPIQAAVHVYVEDVDRTYRSALAAGGVSVEEPRQRDGDPDRRAGVRDPGGNIWWIATQVTLPASSLEPGQRAREGE